MSEIRSTDDMLRGFLGHQEFLRTPVGRGMESLNRIMYGPPPPPIILPPPVQIYSRPQPAMSNSKLFSDSDLSAYERKAKYAEFRRGKMHQICSINPLDNSWTDWGLLDKLPGIISGFRSKNGVVDMFKQRSVDVLHSWNDNGWVGWERSWIDSQGPISIAQHYNERLEIFVQGMNNEVYHKWQHNPYSSWSEFNSLGGECYGKPVTTSNDWGIIELFYKGRHGLNHRWYHPEQGWSSEWRDDCPISNTYDIGRNRWGRTEVFATDNDRKPIMKWQDGDGRWSDWENFGNLEIAHGSIVVGNNSQNNLEVFAQVGYGSDSLLIHKWQYEVEDSNGALRWSDWHDFSTKGLLLGGAKLFKNRFGNLEVYAVGFDYSLMHKVCGSNGWEDWVRHPNGFINDRYNFTVIADSDLSPIILAELDTKEKDTATYVKKRSW